MAKRVKVANSALVIWPNCLFQDTSILKNYSAVYLLEEPLFFGRDSRRDYNINKIKLAYFRASLKCYYDRLLGLGIPAVYVEYDQVRDYQFLRQHTDVSWYDPKDYLLEDKLKENGISGRKVASRLFLVSDDEARAYFNERDGSKRYTQAHYYNWIKRKLGVLENVSSKDAENRMPLPKNHGFKWSTRRFDTGDEAKYYTDAVEWVNSHPLFKENIGDPAKVGLYPITAEGAQEQVRDFVKTRAKQFGPYEDAVDKHEAVLFHSFISVPLNNGLLDPKWALDHVMSHRNAIPINSLEGWVRQLIGWREYQHAIYLVFYKEIKASNHFEQGNLLEWKLWYGQTKTGIPVLDNEIKKALAYGYSHHIPRLCIFLNMFVLLQVRLEDVVQWFSEVICMDAYPWVMYSNIASMGYYDTRFMQKPYITSSAYILKMSNYEKGSWCDTWTHLFYNFLFKKKSRLTGGASVYLRNLVYFEKKGQKEQEAIVKSAEKFISLVTRK